jgi:hypothetical protein
MISNHAGPVTHRLLSVPCKFKRLSHVRLFSRVGWTTSRETEFHGCSDCILKYNGDTISAEHAVLYKDDCPSFSSWHVAPVILRPLLPKPDRAGSLPCQGGRYGRSWLWSCP